MAILTGIHEVIGNTPIVELSRLTKGLTGRLLAKLEYLNPGFSKKDRAALQIINEAEGSGELSPGQTVVELTSGNMGTGLAIVCAVKGYPFVAVMSKGNSMERGRMMKALGAEVILVDQAPGSLPGLVSGEDLQLVEEVAQKITSERNAFRADQFLRRGNVHSHEYGTGLEIWEQTGGKIDVFLDLVGSGGTFTGCARTLKARGTSIRCYVVEPASAPYLAGKPIINPNHKIQGGGYSMDLPFLEEGLIDGYLQVSDDDAKAAARDLARKEGIFAGFSTGANIAAALRLLRTTEQGSTIVVTVNDSGLKYLSTDLFI
ncbi:cysteine synthase family protein [Alicyclobacillus fastidiosus]|uniref:Cysteine synthase family protein n=1 Tax=Alicyclobacillus fastidiosus TaxID=392011 RepID=A0ABY6ZB12_9BACL|nr:cysteine synthase family protein [Alicyclobacillus fastidiosus]WAH40022.1 cysteine synthase family protein [Alicyclobacillus fastidiosus]GMA61320.1 cysteine synthase [Alicyclobacillus fastidiosus]